MKKLFSSIVFSLALLLCLQAPAHSEEPGKTADDQPSMAARITIMPILNLYQNHLGAFSVTKCPSWPNCSHYSKLAVKKHGAFIGLMMTIDRLMHEGGQIKQGKTIFTPDRGYLVYDPLEHNDYWWYEPPEGRLPDIPQLATE